MKITCIQCQMSRFPTPEEQCYKTGGLICTVDSANVGKYDECRFPEGVAVVRDTIRKGKDD
jgi:hypothetical protein